MKHKTWNTRRKALDSRTGFLPNVPGFRFQVSCRKGFSLIELLVVIGIIAILSSIVTAGFRLAKAKAQDVKARATLKSLQTAFTALGGDTGFWPGREAAAGAPDPQTIDLVRCGAANNEVQDLGDPQAGLVATSGDYPGWNGPYISTVPPDPWGAKYFFDTDYDIPPTGDNQFGAAIGSYGPNGVGNNLYDSDDIILLLAAATCP
ncbi:MAG: Uncharacterized protein G01um101472_328 [Parcubacteria group bacterium Gr01-1014_72]|nr:MAG: Uncharacterized protein G01um101472_328 [Parcubacteria group bacterium Gr01-1014_72]